LRARGLGAALAWSLFVAGACADSALCSDGQWDVGLWTVRIGGVALAGYEPEQQLGVTAVDWNVGDWSYWGATGFYGDVEVYSRSDEDSGGRLHLASRGGEWLELTLSRLATSIAGADGLEGECQVATDCLACHR
jgi:hypothetical protein